MGELVKVQIMGKSVPRGALLAVGCFHDGRPETRGLKPSLGRSIRQATRRPGWRAGTDQVLRIEAPDGSFAQVSVFGLGAKDEFELRGLERWLSRTVAEARAAACQKLVVILPDHPVTRGKAGAERVLRRLALSGYRFDEFRRPPAATSRVVKAVKVEPPARQDAAYRSAGKVAREVAEGVTLARDLANTPPNRATPAWMAERARTLARQWGMKARVMSRPELTRRRMGGILAVASGSHNGPRLVRLEWGRGDRVISLVGKGVTFDTGGISIKPAAAMDEMKYDKSGACAVLGIARATAGLDLPFRLRAYLPLVENMPDGAAYRPGDIIRCYNGKTVEIKNTDAEGRMILADALALAAEEGAETLVELATLTGAMVVALGEHGAGLYTPDADLAAELLAAAEGSGEKLWQMPLWPEFEDEIKGHHADLRNVAGRWGGANTAAAFLSKFTTGVDRWAHLDIAGTAFRGGPGGGPKGATGYGVALVVHWLLGLTGRI